MIYPIVKYGNPVLEKPAAPVTEFDDELKTLVADMFESMYEAKGVGLAAPQIGISKRLAVIDVSFKENPREKLVLANNHELGLEQIYLRPYKRGSDVILRVTLVAYERIVDIVEVELRVPDELARKIVDASAHYQRPLWRSFSDSNLL